MFKVFHTTTLGVGAVLSLAACGGLPDGAPVPTEQRAQVSSASGGAIASPQMRAMSGAAMSDDETTSLKQQVALLRREVAEIRQQLARMPGAAETAEASANPRTDPAARAEAERVERQRIASTETAFRSEKEDAGWSRGTVTAIRAALGEADETLRSRVSGVECRSQSCRVVIGGGNSPGPSGQDLSLVLMRLAQTLPNVTAGQLDQGDGRPATVLYLSR